MSVPSDSAALTLDAVATEIPAGFSRVSRGHGFVYECGDFYVDRTRGIVGVRIEHRHLNPLGFAHGGLLATLVDSSFGTSIKDAAGLALLPVTANLNLDYVSPARPGDWVEAHVEIHKIGSRLTNASCKLMVGDRLVVRANSIFAMAMPARATAE